MRRLIDALLSRWYVRRDLYEIVSRAYDQAHADRMAHLTEETEALKAERAALLLPVITTDYQRGIPCS